MIEKFGEDDVLKTLLPLFDGMKEQISFISYNQEILKTIHHDTDYATGIVVDDWVDYNKDSDWQSEWLFCSVEGLPKENDELEINSKIAILKSVILV